MLKDNLLTFSVTETLALADMKLDIEAFQDSTANALQAAAGYGAAADQAVNHKIIHKMAAGTTSATTFKIRCGPSTGTAYHVNADTTGTRVFGGISQAVLTVKEIML